MLFSTPQPIFLVILSHGVQEKTIDACATASSTVSQLKRDVASQICEKDLKIKTKDEVWDLFALRRLCPRWHPDLFFSVCEPCGLGFNKRNDIAKEVIGNE